MTTIGVALIGAGLFCRETVAPDLRQRSEFVVKAIYSRTVDAAKALAEDFGGVPQVYGGDSLSTLLDRPDIEAVIILLPIDVMVRLLFSSA